MESLKRKRHDEIIDRWFAVRTPGNDLYDKPDYDDSHIRSIRWAGNAPASIEELQSYGRHFPLVQAIRDHKRKGLPTRLWLLNGDTWGGASGFGMSTSSQQGQVRSHAQRTDIPWIILPFSAIDAASIDHESIKVLTQDSESWETYTHTQAERPANATLTPVHERVEGTGWGRTGISGYGHVPYASMEEIPAEIRAFFSVDGQPLRSPRVTRRQVFGRTVRDEHYPPADYASGAIETRRDGTLYVPPCYRFVGTKLRGPNATHWDTEWKHDPETGLYSQTRQHHTLGQSVFRAAYRGNNGKRYWANFLSGVDNSPHGSGYFLVQLPKDADVSSVSAAIESLKPNTVRVAESFGLDVKRQGDLFAIPTELDIRKLRAMGASIRQSAKASVTQRAAIRERWETAFAAELVGMGILGVHLSNLTPEQRQARDTLASEYRENVIREQREWDSTHAIHTRRSLYGTRHVGTDVAVLPNGVTLARGTIRHTGGQHRFLSLGKVWHIVARNTVPLAR